MGANATETKSYDTKVETSKAANDFPEFAEMLADLRKHHREGVLRTKEARVRALRSIESMMIENTKELAKAIFQDLGRSELECTTEALGGATAVNHMIDNLDKWMKPRPVPTSSAIAPATCFVQPEAKGVILNITPWNYPVMLLIDVLIEAIGAGNCVVCKPSELSVHSSSLLARLIVQYMDPRIVRVVEGEVAETTALLKLRWDHIVYTGNGFVARIIARAAAEHLTPCTLELGGKNPCIVDKSVDIKHVARVIVIGGIQLNTGQICVGIDYVLVHEDVKEALCKEMVKVVEEYYGKNPKESKDYGRIVNERHFDRVLGLMANQKVLCGGAEAADRSQKFISPTFILDPPLDSPVMQQEVFGPIISIIGIKSIDEAIAIVQSRDKPLAITCHTTDKAVMEQVKLQTWSGGLVFNEWACNVANKDLPFGGVGESGTGAYHGQAGFDEFSHLKAVVVKSTSWLAKNMAWIGRPPYTERRTKFILAILAGPPKWVNHIRRGLSLSIVSGVLYTLFGKRCEVYTTALEYVRYYSTV